MSKQLKVITANDPVAAMINLADVIAGTKALFITAPVVGDTRPEAPEVLESVGDSVGLIVESSGSTGTPKKINLSVSALLHSATKGQERLGPKGQWLLALPINFIAGSQVLIRSLLAETQPVIMNTLVPFTAEAFSRAASMMKAEHRYVSLVPTQLLRLLEKATEDAILLNQLKSFTAILVGGQSVPRELLKTAKTLGINVVVSYGMTETCGGCVYDGVPLEGVSLRIAQDGRLEISGPILAEDVGTWLKTNDLAEIEEDGKLEILGRKDRVIISGGLKLALDRVEHLGSEVKGVTEITATALEDSKWGERVGIAYVGSPEVADDIANRLAELLGPIGKPVRVIRVDKVPKLATGKNDLLTIKKLFEERS
jgi:O-succinylbenzoic acid--CoA ligase